MSIVAHPARLWEESPHDLATEFSRNVSTVIGEDAQAGAAHSHLFGFVIGGPLENAFGVFPSLSLAAPPTVAA